MSNKAKIVIVAFAVMLIICAGVLLTIGAPPVEAGNFLCGSGECHTRVFSGKCFYCLVSPPPAFCSCSATGTCPQAATLCGNCDQACNDTVIACTDKCPGCTHPFNCSVARGNGSASSALNILPTQPTFSAWINSESLLDGVSTTSPLMRQLLLHMRQAKEQWGCSYITGLVVNPNDPSHVQSKAYVHSNEYGVTTFTIFNRSTNQDEVLVVSEPQNSWQLRAEPSFASATPQSVTVLAGGNLDMRSGSVAITNNATPVQPTFSAWINSEPLLDGVSAASPLMTQVLLHMRAAKEEWSSSYITGLVVDPADPQHLQSKVIIDSNEYGTTTFTIVNRSTGRDETLIVHAARNMWQLRAEPSYASVKPASAVILAKGVLDGR